MVEDLELSHLVVSRPKIVRGRYDWLCRQSCLSGNRTLVTILRVAIRHHVSYIVRAKAKSYLESGS